MDSDTHVVPFVGFSYINCIYFAWFSTAPCKPVFSAAVKIGFYKTINLKIAWLLWCRCAKCTFLLMLKHCFQRFHCKQKVEYESRGKVMNVWYEMNVYTDPDSCAQCSLRAGVWSLELANCAGARWPVAVAGWRRWWNSPGSYNCASTSPATSQQHNTCVCPVYTV